MIARLKYAAVTVVVLVMFACTQWELSSVRRLGTDTAFFTGQLAEATRLEKELLQFRLAGHSFVSGEAGVSRDDLQLAFDLLWSRVNTQYAKHDLPRIDTLKAFQPFLADMSKALTSVDARVVALQPGDQQAWDEIDRQFAPYAAPARDMNEAAYMEMYKRAVETTTNQRDAMKGLDVLQWILMISGALGFFFLLRQLRRGELLVANLRDREARIRAMATTDVLTGLHNRRHFDERMEAVDDGTWAGDMHLLLVDLDGFKQVNDHHGHEAGDHVLTQAARRIAGVAGPDTLLARLGGDEFAIVIPGAPDRAASAASTIIDAISRPFPYGQQMLRIGASIGIATRGKGLNVSKTMLREADMALYEAKAAGRNRFHHHGAALRRELDFHSMAQRKPAA